jgi:hypothetical protein
MSQFGMTPISILDKGPMGGFRGGLADSRSIRHSDSALEGESLSQQLQREELEKIGLNKPMDAVKRAYDIAKLENEKTDIESGEFNKARDTERQIKMQELVDKMDESVRRKTLQGAEDSVAVASVFSPEDNEQTAASKWPIAAQIAEQRGIKNFPKEYSIEAWQKLQAQKSAAPSMIKLLQEKDMKTFGTNEAIRQDLAGAYTRHGYDMSKQNDSQEFQAEQNRLNRANNLSVANVRSSGSGEQVLTGTKDLVATRNLVDRALNGDPTAKPTRNDFDRVYTADYSARVEKRKEELRAMPVYQEMKMQSIGDPKKAAAFQKWYRDEVAAILQETVPAGILKGMADVPADATKAEAAKAAAPTVAPEAAPTPAKPTYAEHVKTQKAEEDRVKAIKNSDEYQKLKKAYREAQYANQPEVARSISSYMDEMIKDPTKKTETPAATPAPASGGWGTAKVKN